MGPVISAKLGEYVRNVALDGLLRNAKLIGDLFVRISGRDPSQECSSLGDCNCPRR
jgi:hypothetical protein